MELVIEIPDHIKEELDKLDEGCRHIDCWNITTAIMNGIPLPKGHGDLIDRNALITELETDYHHSLSESGAHLFVEITSYIDDAETIIEADKESNNGAGNQD